LHGYYAAADALKACTTDAAAAQQYLREAADALGEHAATLAKRSAMLASQPAPKADQMAALVAAIRHGIAQAQRDAARRYAASAG
jgi:hypothetical protein